MGEVEVRPARPQEHAAVAELTVAAYREYAERMPAQFWEAYEVDLRNVEERSKDGIVLVAARDDELLGTVAYFPPGEHDPQWFPTDWAWIRALAVPPEHRGQGLGRRLTEECVSRARQDGASGIGLMTTELMSVARALYERIGFKDLQEFDAPMGGRYWTYGMELEVPAG